MDDAAQEYAAEHVAAFNGAVEIGDFTTFLARFADDAVLRFENVPGAGLLEFAGRAVYTSAYVDQPPDDLLDVTQENGAIVIPFSWRRTGARGTMTVIVSAGLIARLTVQFD